MNQFRAIALAIAGAYFAYNWQQSRFSLSLLAVGNAFGNALLLLIVASVARTGFCAASQVIKSHFKKRTGG